jgi:hypothetical protein
MVIHVLQVVVLCNSIPVTAASSHRTPGYTALTAVRGTAIKETRCSSQYNSFILNNTYIDSAIKKIARIFIMETRKFYRKYYRLI